MVTNGLYVKFSVLLVLMLSSKYFHAQIDTNFAGQQKQPYLIRAHAPKIFIDCSSCDQFYYRQQIPFVNFVRDRRLSNVYILVRTIETGNGGDEYTIEFLGQNEFSGISDTLKYNAPPNASNGIVREEVCNLIKRGILPYILKTPLSQKLSYTVQTNEEELDVNKVSDKWDF